jgi:hypothetical protein
LALLLRVIGGHLLLPATRVHRARATQSRAARVIDLKPAPFAVSLISWAPIAKNRLKLQTANDTAHRLMVDKQGTKIKLNRVAKRLSEIEIIKRAYTSDL